MSRSIRNKATGDIIDIPDGMTKAEAIKRYEAKFMAARGVVDDIDIQAAEDEAVRTANAAFAKTGKGRVASFQAGAQDFMRNAANMVLPKSLEELMKMKTGIDVTDQSILDRRGQDAALREENPGTYLAGQVVPSLAIPGAGARGVGRVGTAAQKLLTPGRMAMLEGAATGAAMAGPNERVQGALVGGLGARLMNSVGRGVQRLAGGLAPLSPVAQRAKDLARSTGGGETPFIPLNKAGNVTGEGAMFRWLYDEVLPNFPSAGTNLAKQGNNAVDATMRNIIRRAYGQNAPKVIAEWAKTGRLDKAMDLGDGLVKGAAGNFTKTARETLRQAARKQPMGVPSLTRIGREASGKGTKTTAIMQDMAETMDELMKTSSSGGRGMGGNTLGKRDLFYSIVNKLGLLVPGAIARGLTNKHVQSFIMGDNVAQKAIRDALLSGNQKGIQRTLEAIIRNSAIAKAEEYAAPAVEAVRTQGQQLLENVSG